MQSIWPRASLVRSTSWSTWPVVTPSTAGSKTPTMRCGGACWSSISWVSSVAAVPPFRIFGAVPGGRPSSPSAPSTVSPLSGVSRTHRRKAGITSLTTNLAAGLASDGIRVNAVAPATIRTRVWEGQEGGADRLRRLYALDRVGEPEDVAGAVAFLASSDAAWITGHTLPVDGGLLAVSRQAWEAMNSPREPEDPPNPGH